MDEGRLCLLHVQGEHMNDDIIRMAREAGLCDEEGRDDSSVIIENHLKRFAALVIKPWADQLEVERKKFQELNDVAALGMQHARADERKAIAKMVDDWDSDSADPRDIAAAIRARGQA
jgi:hypothetical protein